MEKKQIIRTALLGVFSVALTLVIGISFAESETLKHMRFWFAIGPLAASEILLTVSSCGLFGKSKDKAFPLRIGSTLIPWGYFTFTLFMALLYSSDISDAAITIIQSIAIFIVMVFIVSFEMASDTIHAHAKETAEANAARISYRATVDGIMETLRGRFPDNKEMNKLFEQLHDAARFACDSVPGAERIESELEDKLLKLEQSAETANEEDLKTGIYQVISAFRKRESVVKSLR